MYLFRRNHLEDAVFGQPAILIKVFQDDDCARRVLSSSQKQLARPPGPGHIIGHKTKGSCPAGEKGSSSRILI